MEVWLTFGQSSKGHTCTHCVPIFTAFCTSVRKMHREKSKLIAANLGEFNAKPFCGELKCALCRPES